MKVLVVDDDPGLVAPVARALSDEGFGVKAATTGRGARELVHDWTPDVVIVGDELRDDSGLHVAIDLRDENPDAYVMVVGPGDVRARVDALLGGADDYVGVPCSASEVAARIVSFDRRRSGTAARVMRFGSLVVDPIAREVLLDGRVVDLPARERDLLIHLASHPHQTFTREELLHAVWHSSAEWQHASTVTEHIRRLRLKLEDDPLEPRLLVTVRGAGYRFEPPDD